MLAAVGPSTVKMKTEQPETDAGPRTPENPVSVQGPVTPLTEQHCENEFYPDQQLCTDKNDSSLVPEEPEPLQIKEEQEDFWTSQEVEQFIQKQETDIFKVTPVYPENELREPEPHREQLLCLTSAVAENQDEEGSWRVESGSADTEEQKQKKRRLKTRIHHEGGVVEDRPWPRWTLKNTCLQKQHVCENEFYLDQQLCSDEDNSILVLQEPEPLQIKEEEEEFWTIQERTKTKQ
ncbi:uncharacterized protein KZ484_000045 [Pholidichthys leucotaenia]